MPRKAHKKPPKNDWDQIQRGLATDPCAHDNAEARTRTQAWLLVPENIERLLEAVASGLSVRRFCADQEITYSPVQRYLVGSEELRNRYYAAQEQQAEHLLGEMERITQRIEDGSLEPDAGRVILDSIKWRLSKFNARRYSDRQVIEQHTFDHTKAHIEAVRQLARKGVTIDGQLAGPAASGPTRALVYTRDTSVDHVLPGIHDPVPEDAVYTPVVTSKHELSGDIPD